MPRYQTRFSSISLRCMSSAPPTQFKPITSTGASASQISTASIIGLRPPTDTSASSYSTVLRKTVRLARDHWTVQAGLSGGCEAAPWAPDRHLTGNFCLAYNWNEGRDNWYPASIPSTMENTTTTTCLPITLPTTINSASRHGIWRRDLVSVHEGHAEREQSRGGSSADNKLQRSGSATIPRNLPALRRSGRR